MSSQKTININPDLFQITSGKTRKKRLDGEKKIKVKSTNAATIKKNKSMMLRRIREKQKENYRKLFEEEKEDTSISNETNDFLTIDEKTDFAESVAFLENIKKEEEQKKKEKSQHGGTSPSNPHNSTIKNYRNYEIENNGYYNKLKEDIQSLKSGGEVSQIFSLPSPIQNNKPNHHPGYGCMKGGTLPTYKMYMQSLGQNQTRKQYPSSNVSIGGVSSVTSPTLAMSSSSSGNKGLENKGGGMASLFMKNHMNPINNSIYSSNSTGRGNGGGSGNGNGNNNSNSNSNNNDDRLKKISELRQMRQFLNRSKEKNAPNKLKYMKRKKTLKRTHYVGKSKVHPKVSVLVSNKTIRKHVARKTEELKQTPIKDVRKYLIKNGFIRIGSTAPNDVLRKMYESANLIGGEIYNHNPENLLHNYLNGNSG
jgi:hypothetical protein